MSTLDKLKAIRPNHAALLAMDTASLRELLSVVEVSLDMLQGAMKMWHIQDPEGDAIIAFDNDFIAEIKGVLQARGEGSMEDQHVSAADQNIPDEYKACPFVGVCDSHEPTDEVRGIARAFRYEVQTRTANKWHNAFVDDNEKPVTFGSEEEAEKELTGYIAMTQKVYGIRLDPKDFRIVPVGYEDGQG